MKGSAGKIQLASLDDLFGVNQSQATEEPFQEILLSDLHPFNGHPFHVMDDEKMHEMAESVAQHGVLVPGIVRPRPEGGYKLVSGHRRKRACELAGLTTMPVFVRELDDDEAVLIMVDSNLQREKILPSEKAFAYRMKLEAMKRKAGRPFNNSVPLAQNYGGKTSREILGEQVGESQDQIRRYIRLTCLLPPLLQMVDENKLVLRPAVELSYLTQAEQGLLLAIMDRLTAVPTLEQAQQLKMYSQNGQLTETKMKVVLAHKKPAAVQVTLKKDRLKQYFPQDYSQKQMEEVIFSLLDAWKFQQEGVGAGDENE
ncbi:ParB/RepB/Spo0J family partition protein [bacterium D16-76]|nr:ParB/RepB/Spo0J family partition protein [bacterium D16-76]